MLREKYEALRARLDDISKVHRRINVLQAEIAVGRCKVENAAAQVKDFQMIRVSKEMLDIIRTDTSAEKRKAVEIKVMNNKLQHARRA